MFRIIGVLAVLLAFLVAYRLVYVKYIKPLLDKELEGDKSSKTSTTDNQQQGAESDEFEN
jgi:hypothetical protein